MSELDIEIFSKLKEISKRLINLQREALASTGIGHAEFKILNVLDVENEFTQTDISDVCEIDKPATSRIINKLVELNLVERSFDNADRRKTYIKLTANGKECLINLRKRLLEYITKYFGKIDESDKSAFTQVLNKLLNKENTEC